MSEVTRILRTLPPGLKEPSGELLPLVYSELRQLAAQKLSLERPGQTLQATALVHEAWLRLLRAEDRPWDSRGHFFVAAAEAMRRILIENARRKQRLKHGGGLRRVDLDEGELACGMPPDDVLALDEALAELEKLDPPAAQVVKLRFFSGLTQRQIAEVLGISLSSIERSWAFSRVWLFQQIQHCREARI